MTAPPRSPPRPSLFDIVFLIWAVVVPIGFSGRLINSDGDLARHLRLGELMLHQHGLLRTDVFSHTAAGKPFLAFEWGSEVVYAAAERVGGLALVSIVAGLVLAFTFALLARFMVRRGGDPLLAYLVSMAAAVLSAGHWLARPHLFTLLLVVVLLELLDREPPRPVWPYLPLFAVWANLHGGFSYGLILIGAFMTGELLEAWAAGPGPDRLRWLGSARGRAAALGAAVLATLANPHGIGLLVHVGGFFGQSSILRQTNEFQSPDFHTVNGKLFLLVLLAVIAAFAFSRRRPSWPWLLIILGNTAMALISQRNIELFALTALPLTALHLDQEWRALPVLGRARAVFQREYRGTHSGVGAGVVALLLVGLGLAHGRVAGVQLVQDGFDRHVFPAAAAERGRAAHLSGPIFNQFTWGGWLLHEWPEMPVFIDGGTDHYGEALFNQYIQVWNLDPGWRDVLEKWKIRWVLVDPHARLAYQLVREPGWGVWYCDSVAALLEQRAESDTAGKLGRERLYHCLTPERSAAGEGARNVPAQR
ncbi:MAG TPA: hypothetical protein VE091_13370 [Gemmatimonadales bacterium]|nr:hypothetical protein [Gemmatimonadales bacterium]